MTAVIERLLPSVLDLPQDDGCQAIKGLCGAQPVVAVWHWEQSCDCMANPERACREHHDEYDRGLAETFGLFECAWCGADVTFVRVEMLP